MTGEKGPVDWWNKNKLTWEISTMPIWCQLKIYVKRKSNCGQMMGGQLKENVWKENVAQTLPEGPVDKRLYQARATVFRLLGYGKWQLIAQLNCFTFGYLFV